MLQLWSDSGATPSVTDSADELERACGCDQLACLVAVSGDRIVGSIFAGFDGWRGNIYRLAVHPEFRRRRIARDLVTAAEDVFANWGVRRISALVEHRHDIVVAFWEAAGFSHDERIFRYVRTLPAV